MLNVRRLVLGAMLLAGMPLVAQSPKLPVLGTAWYPEQWPESRWEADLALMEQAHMHVVRVGEFAWSTLEPAEGRFDFGWLDRAIALAAKHRIAVVLGTPTAAPPAWLTTKYPETLRVDENGQRAEHGNRQHFSYTDPHYRRLAARIAAEMAKRYGHNANVVGWQIDNELAAPSFDTSAKQQFHAWLQHRYGTIAELNRRWATAYWSQTYDRFDQVPLRSKNENPALLLDFKRFETDVWISYVQGQIDVIRPQILPTQFITTNTMHWNTGFDHYRLHKNLDLAAWDDYFPEGRLDANLNAAEHDLVRGYKRRNFWLMETQPGYVNWGAVNATLPRGVVREMAWQAVGHGADAVLYWQWRPARNGQEEYHGSLLGADGLPVPVYGEVVQIGEEFEKAGQALAGSVPKAEVAMLQSYDSGWAIGFQKHTQRFDYVGQMTDYYRAIEPVANTVDILSPETDLAGYKVVFAPALNVLSDAVAKNLTAYVKSGGNLVLGPRSGMKDEDNGLQPERQPGPLADLLGGHVDQYYALDKAAPVEGHDGETGSATVWAETLVTTSPEAKIGLRYGKTADGWLDGQPASLTRQVGAGSITYIGATLDAKLLRTVTESILSAHGVHPLLAGLPTELELMQRVKPDGSRVWILINHGTKPQHVDAVAGAVNLLHPDAPVDLPAHGVAVLSLTEAR